MGLVFRVQGQVSASRKLHAIGATDCVFVRKNAMQGFNFQPSVSFKEQLGVQSSFSSLENAGVERPFSKQKPQPRKS